MNKHNIIEIRKINANDLMNLCINRKWYTTGTNEEYMNLLNIMAGNKESISTDDIFEIASDILNHSSTDYDIEDICFEVSNICYSDFEKIKLCCSCCGSYDIHDVDADGSDIVVFECSECGDIFDYDFIKHE